MELYSSCCFWITNRYSKYFIRFCIITPKFCLINFFRNLVHVFWKFLLTTNYQDQINFFIFLVLLGSYIIGLFSLLFILWLISADHNHLCIQSLFHSHFSKLLLFHLVCFEGYFDYFYFGLKILLKIFLLLKNINDQ